MTTMICLVTTFYHSKILQYYWIYSPRCTFHPCDFVFFGKWIFVPVNQPHLFHSFSNLTSPLVTSCLFSISISSDLLCFFNCFFFTYNWNNMASVFVWLISLSIILSRSIHVVSNGIIIFYGWVIFHCVVDCIYTYIHTYVLHLCLIYIYKISLYLFSINNLLDCLHIFSTVNNAALNINVHVSFRIYLFVFFRKKPRSGIAG